MTLPIGRLVPYRMFSGVENMSLDHMLQESVDQSQQMTLRFYGWSKPTLSLGYFQSYQERNSHGPSGSVLSVRRSTGGGCLVHHHELTYSLIIPQDLGSIGPRLDLYQQVHHCIRQALKNVGVLVKPFSQTQGGQCGQRNCDQFLCFQRRTADDLILNGYKVVGSAQRKSRASLLQHGSLLLDSSQYAFELPGVNDLVTHSVDFEQIMVAIAGNLADLFSVKLREADFLDQEIVRAAEIADQRYGNERWLHRR